MKNKFIHKSILFICIAIVTSIQSQSLLDKLDKEFSNIVFDEIATFKTTRLGLMHSIETRKKGALQLSLYFRYWDTPNATGQKFLADEVSTRYGLEYAFTDNFTFGLGYTNFDKIADGFLKYRLLKQKNKDKKGWFSLTLVQTLSHRKVENTSGNLYQPSTSSEDIYAFVTQALFARKFNPNLSIQIAPTFIHRASNSNSNDANNQFAIGFGGRHKITKHTSLVSEYNYVVNPVKSFDTYNTFMIGVNWEVSDLMLQFHLTNARNFAEDTFLTQTTNNFNFKNPNLHFGVNATYIIHTKKKRIKEITD